LNYVKNYGSRGLNPCIVKILSGYGDMTAAKFRSKAAEILSSTAALRRGSTANTATFGFFEFMEQTVARL